MTVAILPLGPKAYFYGWPNNARSDDGQEVEKLLQNIRKDMAITATMGLRDLMLRGQLREAVKQACEQNWDGQKALPYSPEALAHAKRIANTFPSWVQIPECAVDPDGEIGFDWYCDPENLLSISVGTNGRVSFAGRYEGTRRNGSNDFADELPEDVIQILRRLYPQNCESLAA